MGYRVKDTFIINENGTELYNDISDLTPEQAERLAQLHSENEEMNWETAWEIIRTEELEAAYLPQPY